MAGFVTETVFLSSTSSDLGECREAAYRAIEGLDGYHCVRMEDFGARDAMPDEFCRQKVAECDLFVGLLGHCYGSTPLGSDKSYTQQEYEAAVDAQKPRLIFLAADDFPPPPGFPGLDPRQEAFREQVSSERIRDTFPSPDDLAHKVGQAIHNWERTTGGRPRGPDEKFESEYLDQVAKQFGRIRMLGVREMKDVRQSLSLAYVSLTMRRGEDDEGPRRAEEVLRQEALLTVRGAAGSGKTTLLHWVALQCAQTEEEDNLWRGSVPFFVPLRRLEEGDGGRPDLWAFTRYTIDPGLWDRTPREGWIGRVLGESRAVVLLDGVDELPPARRPAFWEWLSEFVEWYPGNRVVVTSRYFRDEAPEGSEQLWAPPAPFVAADLEEMSDPDVRKFIHN